MKRRRILLIVLGALIGLGVAGRYAWRAYTAPVPPHVPLDGVPEEKVERIRAAERAVRAAPRSGSAWGELGLTLMANGFLEQSIPCFAHAHSYAPKEPQWPYFLGSTMLTSGRREGFDRMRDALALARTPKDRRAVLLPLARALVQDGQFDEAARYAEELRRIDGDSPTVDYVLGLLAVGRNDREAARTHLGRVADHPCARLRVCSLLAALVDDEALSREYLRKASEMPMDLPWPDGYEDELTRYRTESSRGLARYTELQDKGQHEEALALLRDLVATAPEAGTCFMLGFTLMSRNEFAEAAASFRKATQISPRDAKLYMFLSMALSLQGQNRAAAPGGRDEATSLFREAVKAADTAIQLRHGLVDAHLTRGQALKRLGDFPGAIASFRQAVLIGPEFAEMHQELGEALAENGQVREGIESLETAVRLAKLKETKPQQALDKWMPKAKAKP
ncbi:MAG: tetratricopeptide repeat protein [Planctomycetes bacterium]|nr:tetratricopeptide repeat protein [Planctomycetota bacterium]